MQWYISASSTCNAGTLARQNGRFVLLSPNSVATSVPISARGPTWNIALESVRTSPERVHNEAGNVMRSIPNRNRYQLLRSSHGEIEQEASPEGTTAVALNQLKTIPQKQLTNNTDLNQETRTPSLDTETDCGLQLVM